MDLSKLNPAQKEAVTHTSGPLLIVAGAGTGKTTVIASKIAYLIEQGHVMPEEILALTFTEKAAHEMQERVDSLVDVGYADMQISTFHGFCQRILEEFGLHIGLPDSFRLLTQTDAWMMMHDHIYDFSLDYFRPLGNPYRHIHALISHFQKCKDELISPEQYLEHAESLKADADEAQLGGKSVSLELANAFHVYQQTLLSAESLDFADLQFYTAKLLDQRPAILKLLKARYKYVLVDEFQDVNWAQYQLVQSLADGQLCAVGDDDQSIYAFRGASVANILRFREDYPQAKHVVLQENYRSGQNVLDLSYASVQLNNPDRLEEKLSIDKRLRAHRDENGVVQHHHFATAYEEAEFIAEEIVKLHKSGVPFHEMAVLGRANAHIKPVLASLETHRVPHHHVAASGLFRHSIVVDAINMLRVLHNLSDSLALHHVLRMKSVSFDSHDLHCIVLHAKKKAQWYWSILRQPGSLRLKETSIKKAAHVVAVYEKALTKAKVERPSAMLFYLLESLGVFAQLTADEQKGSEQAMRNIQYLKQFFELAAQFEQQRASVTVDEFLHHIELLEQAGDTGVVAPFDHEVEAVQVMTAHASKGLEFHTVFVVNMVQDRFPTRRKGGDIEIPLELIREQLPEGDIHIQEERRLFYVAITRAKSNLYLTSAASYGGTREKKVSRFIEEVRHHLDSITHDGMLSQQEHFSPPEEPIESGLVLPLPKTFSFSQVRSYQTCPYQYHLAHVLKLPMKGSASFSFGNTVHNTLEAFYKKVKMLNSAQQSSLFDVPEVSERREGIVIPPLQELLKLYEEHWIPDWYLSKQQREDYHKKGIHLLTALYQRHQREQSWVVPLFLESSFRIRIGKHTITGKIDKIEQAADGSLHIVDYKTGQAKEKLTTDDKDQLLLYQIAATELPQYAHVGQVGKLTFHYVNEDKELSFLGGQKDIARIGKKVEKILDAIGERKFDPTPSAHTCGRCDFRHICSYRV